MGSLIVAVVTFGFLSVIFVFVLKASVSIVIDSELFVGIMSVSCILPQYLISAMLIGLMAVTETTPSSFGSIKRF